MQEEIEPLVLDEPFIGLLEGTTASGAKFDIESVCVSAKGQGVGCSQDEIGFTTPRPASVHAQSPRAAPFIGKLVAS